MVLFAKSYPSEESNEIQNKFLLGFAIVVVNLISDEQAMFQQVKKRF